MGELPIDNNNILNIVNKTIEYEIKNKKEIKENEDLIKKLEIPKEEIKNYFEEYEIKQENKKSHDDMANI